ncbi:HAMP domain-containing protein [Epibacterium sp. SM1979]|uniref:histidine kinase n=1 Tax=Tritonibacter litoralis TaxID=2662264 RepID=A0A843YE14_9RHOB|nr:ATP-binding protein [Tritonibacter litoralis]MQQ07329.1 HAMP domain-containing protein [Tritonibacter litoralis]
MARNGLKNYVPRSLYGRAALILLLPVVVLQLVVSTSFVRRDLTDVTGQMTYTIMREIDLLEDVVARADSQEEALQALKPYVEPLRINVRFLPTDAPAERDILHWTEFSGRVVRDTLRSNLPQVLAVQMPNSEIAAIVIGTHLGPMKLVFDQRRVTAAAPHQLILTLVAFSFLMTVISFVYMRNQLRPIKKLAEAALAFGRGRSVPYQPRGASEVKAAGTAFVNMRARIERQIEQRTLILSGVSHDLRTPLTRLRLGLAMLDEDDAEPMLRDVDEMQALLDAFLDFSRGVATSASEDVDAHALAETIVGDWQRQGKDVMLGDMVGSGLVTLKSGGMRRAIENLISNAVRYGSRARVSVMVTDHSLRIRVEDDGPGIPQSQWNEAVRPFTRLDPSRNQNKGSGVGLGLAIVADVARAHGGVLRLGTSESLGGLQADLVIGR